MIFGNFDVESIGLIITIDWDSGYKWRGRLLIINILYTDIEERIQPKKKKSHLSEVDIYIYALIMIILVIMSYDGEHQKC